MKLEDLNIGWKWKDSDGGKPVIEAAIDAYVARQVDAAVKAALVGMVPRPDPPDLTSSTDQHGKFRCLSCGVDHAHHVEAECPRGAAERWAAKSQFPDVDRMRRELSQGVAEDMERVGRILSRTGQANGATK